MQSSGQSRNPIPESWTTYERGGREGSTDSGMSHNRIHFDAESQQHHHHHEGSGGVDGQQLRQRRSSMGIRLAALRQAGGVNSLDNFARSWQRAAGFYEVTPIRQSFRYADDGEVDGEAVGVETNSPREHRSLLRQHLAAENQTASEQAVDDNDDDVSNGEQDPLLSKTTSRAQADDNIFTIEPSLASPFGASYGSTWGSLASRVNEPSMRHAGRLFRQQQMKGISAPDTDREPLLVKQIQDDEGKVVNVVVGQSTLPQTVFNSVNVLIGVGLLALPLAMRYAGWIPGLTFFIFAGVSTCYTARLLAKCADVDGSLITFADLAYVSFGPWARLATSILFSLELLAACVALTVLFADSLDALIPGWGNTEWKMVCGVILIPLSFVPLRLLSFTSILGILACFGIVMAVLVDGLIKTEQPGSLRQPATTYLFPANWGTLPIAFGILMSPWGGHSVFPNIYRDMRHPSKYRKAVNITYISTSALDLLMAAVGLLMFGDGVKDEITRNILTVEGYPRWISVLVVICVAIIPLTKVPLNARPIVTTLEIALGLDVRALGNAPATHGMSSLTRGLLKALIRILCVVIFVILAVLVPDFDRIMSLLGAVACFTICVILPCAFHLKLFGKDLSTWQKAVDWFLIVVSTGLALVSTAFNFVPKEKLGL